MENNRAPFIRLGIAAAAIILLLYLPTREFLKMTFILGIPFVLFLALMRRNVKYSFLWFVSVLLLLGVTGLYIYSLTTLPDRIETRKILMNGESLLADGKYDEAIEQYRQLEQTGETNKMNDKIARVVEEKNAEASVETARQLMAEGQYDAAQDILQGVPADTRAAQQAVKLMREIKQKGKVE